MVTEISHGDRQLLEDAAKAAGLRVGFENDGKERGNYDLYWSHVHHQFVWHGKSAGSEYPTPVFWNPLTDDGDALRLAVKLGISMTDRNGRPIGEQDPDFCDDPYAATRRAIVRAAAEIGRNMK